MFSVGIESRWPGQSRTRPTASMPRPRVASAARMAFIGASLSKANSSGADDEAPREAEDEAPSEAAALPSAAADDCGIPGRALAAAAGSGVSHVGAAELDPWALADAGLGLVFAAGGGGGGGDGPPTEEKNLPRAGVLDLGPEPCSCGVNLPDALAAVFTFSCPSPNLLFGFQPGQRLSALSVTPSSELRRSCTLTDATL